MNIHAAINMNAMGARLHDSKFAIKLGAGIQTHEPCEVKAILALIEPEQRNKLKREIWEKLWSAHRAIIHRQQMENERY